MAVRLPGIFDSSGVSLSDHFSAPAVKPTASKGDEDTFGSDHDDQSTIPPSSQHSSSSLSSSKNPVVLSPIASDSSSSSSSSDDLPQVRKKPVAGSSVSSSTPPKCPAVPPLALLKNLTSPSQSKHCSPQILLHFLVLSFYCHLKITLIKMTVF